MSHEIKVRGGDGQYLFAARQVAVEDFRERGGQLAEYLIEHRAVKRFFVLVVVVKEGLVDAGSASDVVGTSAGGAFCRKLVERGLEDGVAGGVRVAAGTATGRRLF